MSSHIVIDGNAFYEIDEECLERLQKKREAEQFEKQNQMKKQSEMQKQSKMQEESQM